VNLYLWIMARKSRGGGSYIQNKIENREDLSTLRTVSIVVRTSSEYSYELTQRCSAALKIVEIITTLGKSIKRNNSKRTECHNDNKALKSRQQKVTTM
jgi:hypothetical protein